ncbi:hypothetical protein CW745_03750 [Psychromonas sp. psych-6C06]|uniref:hypothetical protein n=1 Tax=Psychromonas sp. psych-6C06 TaxID=2058089 RepID=UPI000C326011|nr:hypothetical protein [Psychromonas sp. psych-6C06]PKF62550.1 hypothetical protein CW745_03750 [Psychromonas sp. psych-6C06]
MRCMFCQKEVFDENDHLGKPISIPSRGVAHSQCAEEDLIEKRIFGSIHITEISLEDLYELRELVKTEINERVKRNNEAANQQESP